MTATRIISVEDAQERLGKMLPEVVEDFTRIVASGGSGGDKMIFDTFKKKFMGSVLPKVPEELAQALFRAFDPFNAQSIDLNSFICGLAVLRLGTAEERMRLIFNAYDRSRTGHLSKADLLHYATISSADSLLTKELSADVKKAEKLLMPGTDTSRILTHFTFPQFTEWASKQVSNTDANVDVIVWIYEFEDLLHRKGIRAHHHDLLLDSYFPTQGSLVLQTGLSDHKVSDLTEAFNKMQSTSSTGLLDKKVFCDSLPSIATDIKESLFKAVDESQTGSLSRTELLNAVALCSEGSQRDKLLFCFKMFSQKPISDKKTPSEGFELDRAEFTKMVETVLTPQRLIDKANGVKGDTAVPKESSHLIEKMAGNSDTVSINQVLQVRDSIASEFLSTLWYVVSLDLQIRPNHEEEETVISILNSPQYHPVDYTGPAGTVWYLIDQKWWSDWKQSVNTLEICGTSNISLCEKGSETWVGSRTLPQLTSQRLLDGYGYLHRNINWAGLLGSELTASQKAASPDGANAFEVISPSAWKALASWYGGSKSAIARTVIEISGHTELELHPPCIKVLQGSPLDEEIGATSTSLNAEPPYSEIAFSALNTLRMIVKEASELYGIDETAAILWEKSHTGLGRSTRWLRVMNLSRTLLEADVADGSQFMLCSVSDVKAMTFGSTDATCSLCINPKSGAILKVHGASTIVNSADIIKTNSGTYVLKCNGSYSLKLTATGDQGKTLVSELHKLLEVCGVDTVVQSDSASTISLLEADFESLACGVRVECELSSRKVKATILSVQRQTVKVLPYHSNTAVTIPKRSILRLISGREDPVSLGRVGLQNLTNTCYMNSIIQVFSHTKPIRDYLVSGRFLSDLKQSTKSDDSGGKVAMSLSELLEKLWTCDKKYLAPRNFRALMGTFRSEFSTNHQQDANDFLLALLEVLNEDVNVATQPSERRRRDSSEDANRSDQSLAEEAWGMHAKWVRSFFTSLFAWQHKTTRICTVCSRRTRSIETVVPTLSLALPVTDFHYVNVSFHRLSDRVLNLTVKLPHSATINHLVQELASKIDVGGVPVVASNMITMELSPGGSCFELPIWKAKDNVAQKVSSMRDKRVHVFEATGYHKMEGSKILAQMVQRRLSREDQLFAAPWKPHLLGYPALLCTTDGCGKDLYEAVWNHMNKLVSGYSKDEVAAGNYPFVLTRVTIDGMTCSDCGWLRGCIGCKIENDTKPHNVQHRDTIGIDWDPAVLEKDYITQQPVDHSTVSECTEDRRVSEQELRLHNCISTYFEKDTQLETPLECTSCKGLTIHTQSVAAWALPPVLVIQLKRFTWSAENGGQKVQTPVAFPITGLDLSEVMSEVVGESSDLLQYAPQLSRSETIYDLTAVVNHEGVRTTWGHYDCFVRESGRWLHLNDSQCHPIQESEIQTSKAYLLFYTRRNLDAAPLSTIWPETQTDPAHEARAEDLRRQLRKAEDSRRKISKPKPKSNRLPKAVYKRPTRSASSKANDQCACCLS
eukprot:TRINITY_DN14105_c2_g1_i3.p1 TRINITY_DN14105_c2_g1~~TRINITY_DN14105_c2_g1_i3.p1  ORF type:complete len:1500 (+),score=275.12 TRINITY_DN14105_c2_g1_i3:69-4568(+)